MKKPYFYVNGECINDKYSIVKVKFASGRVTFHVIQEKEDGAGVKGLHKLSYVLTENDIRMETKEI